MQSKAEAFVAEATEVISVVRIGISLVEHIYKVFAHIFQDSGLSDADILGQKERELEAELLAEYRVITGALDRLAQSNEQLQLTIYNLQRNLPQLIRSVSPPPPSKKRLFLSSRKNAKKKERKKL